MIICPWCGTHYIVFQSNCKNCGGPIPAPLPAASPDEVTLEPPPPAPREISDRYVFRLMTVDGGSIAGLVLLLLGLIFLLVGLGLTLGVVTAFVGIPFAFFGLANLVAAGVLLNWRYTLKSKIVEVLRDGQVAGGQITAVEQNFSVRINGHNPWIISYRFQIDGQNYTGQVSTLSSPDSYLQPGRQAYILYSPGSPDQNALYPHP